MLGHNRKMSGAECMADMLQGYGVTHVFHVPAVLRKTYAVMESRTTIKRLHVHSEATAAYMADGYARASGKPGICMAQVIGALNLAAGLRDAWLAHSPVIAMTGGRDAKTKFRKVYQEIDDMPAFEPVTKFNATVDDVSRFPDMVRQAFRTAVSGTPGPVHLQFRGNEGQVDAEEAELEPLVEAQFSRVPSFRPEPDGPSVDAALKCLQGASRPVIVAGGGVRASGAAAELVALAEALQIPVATSLNGKDSIPGNHSLAVGVVGSYSRESANRVVNGADLVCFIGSETGGMTTHFWAVPKIGTPAIQIDINAEALGRNYPLQAAVNGDAKVTLENTATSFRQTAEASAEGVFHFDYVPPGDYAVTVTANGFSSWRQGIVVTVGQSTTVNAQLKVGSAETTVTVSSETAPIQTENGDITTSYNEAQIKFTPNPGGDLTYVAQTAPGAAT